MNTSALALNLNDVRETIRVQAFPSICQIQMLPSSPTQQLDDLGAPVPEASQSRTVRPGHEAIPCANAPMIAGAKGAGAELRTPKMTTELNQYQCMLDGYFPNISLLDQAVIDGVTYQIQGSNAGQTRLFTYLQLRTLTV